MKTNKSKKAFYLIAFFIFLSLSRETLGFLPSFSKNNLDFSGLAKKVALVDGGCQYETSAVSENVGNLIKEKNIKLGERDKIFPGLEEKIYPGMKITVRRSSKIKISVDKKTFEAWTLGKSVREALKENNVELGRLDQTAPDLNFPVQNNAKITVTRINVEEITKEEALDFKTISKSDPELSWREKKIETKGEKGTREIKYKITYQDGREVSRTVLEKKVTKNPVEQVEIQGTYVKLGKKHQGKGTWYAWKGGMYAANPWLPMGSFVKVTNKSNGKSVIVEINDRGPFGPGRIIDLDKAAFQKIASLGAGVIDVKMEEILN